MSEKQLHSGWLKTRTDEKFAPNTLTDNIYTAQGEAIKDTVRISGEENDALFIIDNNENVILQIDEDGLKTTNGHFTDDVTIDEDVSVTNIFTSGNIVAQGDLAANEIDATNITIAGHETIGGNLSIAGDASISGSLEVDTMTTLNNGINLARTDTFYIVDGTENENVIAYVDANGIHAEAFLGSGEEITLNDKDKAVVTDGNNKLHTEDLSTTDPTASGFGTAFIDTISQNGKGKISATKKTIPDGTTAQKGIVQLTNSYDGTNETLAATGKSIAAAITDLNATGLIETAINALDVPEVGGSTTYITTISETDGKITATSSNATVGGAQRPIYINNGTFTPVTLDGNKILYYNNDSLKGSTSYVSNDKVAINSTQEPDENLYVNGNIGFEEGLISKQGDGFYITDGRNDQYVAFGITSDGTPIAPTAEPNNSTNQIATTAFVTNAISTTTAVLTNAISASFAANDAMVFKGTIGASPATVSSLPNSGYRAGWTYRVVTSGIYAGQYCEPGDLIIAVGFTPANSDWTVVQNNVDGAVYVGQPGGAVGSTTQPVYVDTNGKVTAITGAIGNDTTGNAATATKLETARSLTTKLDSTTPVTFDGSADQNAIPVSGILGLQNGGTGTSNISSNQLIYANNNQLTTGTHYISDNKIAINSSTQPNETLHVNGTAYINGDLTFNAGLIANNSDAFYLIDSQENTVVIVDNNGLKTTSIETTGNITPHDDNIYNLGANAYKWSNVYATAFNGDLSGNATTATRANLTTTQNALVYYNDTSGTFADSEIIIIPSSKHIGGWINGGQKTGTTLGSYATAEGYNTTASGSQSHAEGLYTTASGSQSHAEGWGTIAQRRSQHVFGEYNSLDTGNGITRGTYVEIVGKGTADNARSNARTLDWDGNESLAGNLLPMVTNTKDLGSSSLKWANIYATTIHGALDGNAATATKATNDSDNNPINTTYVKNVAWDNNNKKITYLKNGTANDVVSFVAGTGISLTAAAGSLTIENAGVTGVKGNVESTYRVGQVNLTPSNILGTGSTAQFWRGDNTWSSTLTGGLTLGDGLTIEGANAFYITDGSQNQNVVAYFDDNGLTLRKINIKDENGNNKNLVYYSQVDSSIVINF